MPAVLNGLCTQPITGKVLRRWGAGVFYMPHMLRVDSAGNVWVADVGRHQVLKFAPDGQLLMEVGTKLEPGGGKDKLCKPTQVRTRLRGCGGTAGTWGAGCALPPNAATRGTAWWREAEGYLLLLVCLGTLLVVATIPRRHSFATAPLSWPMATATAASCGSRATASSTRRAVPLRGPCRWSTASSSMSAGSGCTWQTARGGAS